MTKKKIELLLFLNIFAFIGVLSYAVYLWFDNYHLKNQSSLIYAGADAPQDIVCKINQSMESFNPKDIDDWYKDRVYDKEFKIACFYSYLAISLAEKCKLEPKNYKLSSERDFVLIQMINKWNALAIKDIDMNSFRDNYLKKYKEIVNFSLKNN